MPEESLCILTLDEGKKSLDYLPFQLYFHVVVFHLASRV